MASQDGVGVGGALWRDRGRTRACAISAPIVPVVGAATAVATRG